VVPVTIPAAASQACADIPIIDDDIALEGDETFQVTLVVPPGTPSSHPDTATVTIKDDDGKMKRDAVHT